KGIDLSRLLYQEPAKPGVAVYNCERQEHHLDKALDNELIAQARPALEERQPVRIERPIRNVHRTVGAMLSGEVARRYGHSGLPQDAIWATFRGNAGQSFGAFLAHGVTLELHGDANDYRQGAIGRAPDCPPAAAGTPRADREHHHRQYRTLWRD